MKTVKECLDYMESGRAWSCRYVTYNRQKKTGGEVEVVFEAVLAREEEGANSDRNQTRAEQRNNIQKKEALKNPNHSQWYTRNYVLCEGGIPSSIVRKLHPPLLIEFNGEKVVP